MRGGPRVLRPGAEGLLDERELEEVVARLRAGEPVALPTETVYGLAADARSAEACAEVFRMKGRPFTDPLICHLPEPEALERWGRPTMLARELARRFWPGGLTLVVPKREGIPEVVTAGLGTAAFRCSAHPVFGQVAGAFGGPLAAPSANRFGRISPTTAEAVLEELGDVLGLVVDGGACAVGVESTIVQPLEREIVLLRRGPVQVEELEEFAPVREAPREAVAPGRLPWHYAPGTPLRIVRGGEGLPFGAEECAALAWSAEFARGFAWRACEVLSARGDLAEAARNFYGALRRLDGAGARCIVAEALPEEGLGLTLMERLRKAAAREQQPK